MHIFHNTSFDFLRWRWHAVALSWVLIIAGLAVGRMWGVPLGLEFAGGTEVIAQFDQTPTIERVRSALDKNFPGGGKNVVVQTYGEPAQRQVMIRVPQVGEEGGDAALNGTRSAAEAALRAGNLGNFSIVGSELVTSTVGRELSRKGVSAFVLSLLAILVYIALRFEFSFAVGAVVATVHDILVTFAFLAFFQYDLTLNVIAALLTVTGYSTNDTIVIFDRVRENLRSMRGKSLHEVVNISLNQTLGRTVITAGTALLSAIALFLFGGEVLRGFAFTMIVGIVTGTYSSVFVAAAIVTFWNRKNRRLAATTAPSGSAAAGQGGGRKQKRARAS